ncbi:hypothetical protein [Emticicia sp. 17c]|uniref:hypothetical protein n=1 Tax=Emticicia sp. 17c TaxID=3127704 RepID=UPI00301DCF15
MDKNKLSYYSSYVAIICGILLVVLRFFTPEVTNAKVAMGLLFITIGFIGLRRFRQ